jgi:hypothetical protein
MRTLALALAACAVLAGPARAAEAPPPLAVQLAKAQTPREQYDRMMQALAANLQPTLQAQLGRAGAQVPPDLAQRVTGAVAAAIPYDDMIGIAARVLSKHFAPEEMKGLIAFLQSPLGRKLVSKQPEIAADTMGEVLPLLMKRMPQIQKALGTPAGPR